MKSTSMAWIAVTAVTAFASPLAMANYYVGAEVAREHLLFKTNYSFVNGTPQDVYHNRETDTLTSVLAGYRWVSADRYALSLQGRLSVSDTNWTLSIPEPAAFRYDLPVSGAVSLLPSYRLNNKLTVFVETGLAFGQVRERKTTTNPASSRYDESSWQPGLVAGFGVSVDLAKSWSVQAGYRRAWYGDIDYPTYDASGTQIETVSSRAVQSATSLAIVHQF